MGYRSDVTIVIYPDPGEQKSERYDTLKVLMNTTFKSAYEEWDECFTWLDHPRVLQFQIQSIKWYPSYPDVQALTTMLDAIGEMEGYNYEFMRIGEDSDDIESNSRGDHLEYYVQLTRSIEVNL